ncbi:hypothetical protein DXU06_17075 [Bradyrhizobium elkanii]
MPGIPAVGRIFSWYDATDTRFHDIDYSGVIGTTVVPSVAPAHKFATGIGSNGAVTYTQPAIADLAGGAWTAYTPVVTAQTGAPTTVLATGRYLQIGKTVFVEMDITLTKVGTAANSLLASLPFAAAAFRYPATACEYTVGKGGAGIIAPGGTTLSTRDASYPSVEGRLV